MAHQRLQSDNVTTALPEESIGEAVSKLVRGKGPNPGASADSPHHPHQRLAACRSLRVGNTANTLVLRHPLLHLNGEQVIVKLGLQLLKARAKFSDNVRIERQPIPMVPLPMYADATPY